MHERVVDGTRTCRAHDGCGDLRKRGWPAQAIDVSLSAYPRMPSPRRMRRVSRTVLRTRAGVAHVGVCEGADGTGMVWMRVRARGHAYVTSVCVRACGCGGADDPGMGDLHAFDPVAVQWTDLSARCIRRAAARIAPLCLHRLTRRDLDGPRRQSRRPVGAVRAGHRQRRRRLLRALRLLGTVGCV